MKYLKRLMFPIFMGLLACKPEGEVFDHAICIQNITTIDPAEGSKEGQTVIIKEGKILRIAPTSGLKLSTKNQIIDGTGKYLIPGLWDAHVHFAYMDYLAPRMFDLFLLYGITSVRDTGGEIMFVKKWKDAALAHPTDAPRVMIAGPLLDGMPNVYDGSDPGHPPLSIGSGSVEALEKLVHKLDSLDVDFLKAYEMLSPEQYYKLMEMAKRLGYKVTGHVPLSMDVTGASNAGLNSMEHMRNLELSCASNAEELLIQRHAMLNKGRNMPGGELRSSIHAAQREKAVANYDEKKADEIIQVLLKNQTWQIPTLTLNTSQARPPYARPEWQESFEYLPDTTRDRWRAILKAGEAQPASPFRQNYSQWMMAMAGKLHKAGVPIMAGTDTPIAFLTPGLSLHEELVSLVEAGLSTQEALKAATINPAIYFGMENELGSIRESQWADLLILSANPLDDIRNTQQIEAVFKQGKLLGKSELDSIRTRLRNL